MHHFDIRRALRALPVALAAAAAIATGGFAAASGLGFLTNAPAGNFTADDVQIQQDAASALIKDGGQGDSREWANPKTTAKGKLTIVKVFKSTEGFTCKTLFIQNSAVGWHNESTYPVCEITPGEWKIYTSATPAAS